MAIVDVNRLRVDPEYWDSVAPIDATHFDSSIHHFYQKITDVYWCYFNEARSVWSKSSKKNLDESLLISRPEPKLFNIDWANAPIEATHWQDGEFLRWIPNKNESGEHSIDVWENSDWTKSAYAYHSDLEKWEESGAIPRPKPESTRTVFEPEEADIDWDSAPSLATHWDEMRKWWVSVGNPVQIWDLSAEKAGWQTRVWLKPDYIAANPERFIQQSDDEHLLAKKICREFGELGIKWSSVNDGMLFVDWTGFVAPTDEQINYLKEHKSLLLKWFKKPDTPEPFNFNNTMAVHVARFGAKKPEQPTHHHTPEGFLLPIAPTPSEPFDAEKARANAQEFADQFEAAQKTSKYPHYFKDVSKLNVIDVYAVLRLFEVTDPCLQHIIKKALCAGKRGSKDFKKDCTEIADTANRLIELESGK